MTPLTSAELARNPGGAWRFARWLGLRTEGLTDRQVIRAIRWRIARRPRCHR